MSDRLCCTDMPRTPTRTRSKRVGNLFVVRKLPTRHKGHVPSSDPMEEVRSDDMGGEATSCDQKVGEAVGRLSTVSAGVNRRWRTSVTFFFLLGVSACVLVKICRRKSRILGTRII